MPRGQVRLSPGRQQRILAGHSWVYRTEVREVAGAPAPGDLVDVTDSYGRFLGRGFFNPMSMILVRLLTRNPDEAVDLSTMRRRISLAWQHREKYLGGVPGYRLVFAEADFLPGLIVDRFGDVLVVQTLALGMDRWLEPIADLLMEFVGPRMIFERNDVPVRELEGLPQRTGVLRGGGPVRFWLEENGLHMMVDVETGQKTGHFLDQRDNRAAIRPYCQGAVVLDAFCHTGGFSLNAALAGAHRVVALDNSAAALAVAVANAQRNACELTCVQENAFDYLRTAAAAGEKYDVIILDPPAFAKNRKAVPGAVRGYKEINLRAMKLLRPGGVLVTCSCSHHVSPDLFGEVVAAAGVDSRRRLRVLANRSQPPDHPVLIGHDESHYLKCMVIQVV